MQHAVPTNTRMGHTQRFLKLPAARNRTHFQLNAQVQQTCWITSGVRPATGAAAGVPGAAAAAVAVASMDMHTIYHI